MSVKTIHVMRKVGDDSPGQAIADRVRVVIDELDADGYRIVGVVPFCGADGTTQSFIISGQK